MPEPGTIGSIKLTDTSVPEPVKVGLLILPAGVYVALALFLYANEPNELKEEQKMDLLAHY